MRHSLSRTLKYTLAALAVGAATQAAAQVTFYEHDDFQGQSFTTERNVRDFGRFGFNDRSSSFIVLANRWEVCEDAQFGGRCVVVRPGRYASLGALGLNDRVSSVRAVNRNLQVADDRYAPPPVYPAYDNRRRNNENVFDAPVTSVRAVMGTPTQRCWIEREQVSSGNSGTNVPGALAGALIGGILGHQVGGGFGKDVATAGGLVAGAAVGARAGRDDNNNFTTQDVQRCATTNSGNRPDYWDVTYTFRGLSHRIQMTSAPGSTVRVNARGEPRA